MSDKAADKLRAALAYTYGEMASRGDKSGEYARVPFYYDALWLWCQKLNPDRRELVSHIIDAWAFPDRRKAAETWAGHLQSGPKWPADLG